MIAMRRAANIVERNALAYRRMWWVFAAGFAEPVLYLLSIGIGVGGLVGDLPGPGGRPVPYEAFVAPGMMAVAAMNGSVIDTTFNFFVKLKYLGVYKSVLATPMEPRDVAYGEVAWGLLRGTLYSTAFLVTMVVLGLTTSWWAVLAVPGALLIGFAFAGVGLAGATFLRSFVDLDYVNLGVIPLFLFSGTFFPLSRYPEALQWVVRATPLYQGVDLLRTCTLGPPDWTALGHAVYLAVMGIAGMRLAGRRLGMLMQP